MFRIAKPLGLCFAGAAAALVVAAPAQAQVAPGDTFSFDISGYPNGSTSGYSLTGALTATFGTTQTFVGAGPNGQDLTMTSSGTANSATFTLTTPTSFITTTTFNGITVNQLQLDLGNANSGSNPVNFLTPIDNSYVASGYIIYGANNTRLNLTPGTTPGTGNLSFSAAEGVTSGTTAISSLNVRTFSYTLNFTPAAAPVPEAATWAMLILGMGAIGSTLRRRQKVAVRFSRAA